MGMIYGIGAAIVILGAMFKILHLPGAGLMLGVGLTTEAVIFFLSAFEKPHTDPDWSLVYPELAGMDGHGSNKDKDKKAPKSVSQELDSMFAEAKVEPELIRSLGDGLRTFGDKVSTISNAADAAGATSEFSAKVKSASASVGQLEVAYANAATSLEGIASTTGDAKAYQEQMHKLAGNLSSLNTMYEMELQDQNNNMKKISSFYGSINETMQQFSDSVNDAKSFRSEVGKLTQNLSALNSVYGNMLSAMNYNRPQ